jgi:hypothetical protein
MAKKRAVWLIELIGGHRYYRAAIEWVLWIGSKLLNRYDPGKSHPECPEEPASRGEKGCYVTLSV